MQDTAKYVQIKLLSSVKQTNSIYNEHKSVRIAVGIYSVVQHIALSLIPNGFFSLEILWNNLIIGKRLFAYLTFPNHEIYNKLYCNVMQFANVRGAVANNYKKYTVWNEVRYEKWWNTLHDEWDM